MSEREAFESALRVDPYDRVTRLVFADYLEENDQPEEADWQRAWTPRRQKGEEYLRGFADRINAGERSRGWPGDPPVPEVTFEEVVEAARAYVKDRDISVLGGQGYSAQTLLQDEDTARLFWEAYQAYSGEAFDIDDDDFGPTEAFQCSC
jgi:uncharacterized protein (TIGR02996 family)